MNQCSAIILAGGAGSRLGPLTDDLPKPMLPISGRPFVEFLILRLAQLGILDVVMSVGYRQDVIKRHFGDGRRWGVSVTYSTESVPLGTGGALRAGAELARHDSLLGLNGDSFFDCDMLALVRDREAHHSVATIALTSAIDPDRYGSVATDDQGWITEFSEKVNEAKPSVNAGVYACSKQLLDWIPPGKVSLEYDVLPDLAAAKMLRGLLAPGFFVDIGTPSAYRDLNRDPSRLFQALSLSDSPDEGQPT
jgi:NDP-sugar pyrophosphorylase family protein